MWILNVWFQSSTDADGDFVENYLVYSDEEYSELIDIARSFENCTKFKGFEITLQKNV